MCAIVALYELTVVCVFVMDVSTMPLNNFMSHTTEDSSGFNPTAVYRATARNSLDNINVKELLEKLNKLDKNKWQVTVSDRDTE